MYEYGCTVTRCIDGDTVEATVDLGFHLAQRMTIRLWGINTPEINGATRSAGLAAKARLEALTLNRTLVVRTILDKHDSFGRVIGLFLDQGKDLNQQMVDEGFAVPFMRGHE